MRLPFSNKERDQKAINGNCIMLEGLFNTLGHDIIGMATIVPLFLSFLGASLNLIGAMSSMQSIASTLMPLLLGGVVAGTKSKRNFSMLVNGLSRFSILLIPLAIVLKLPSNSLLVLFFIVMAFFSLCQPITGLSWNYLLGNCVEPAKRGKLLGTLFALSGIITFASSNIIKWIRATPALSQIHQFAAIFALGGLLMGCSVLFYIPLKEDQQAGTLKAKINIAAYIQALLACFKNKAYLQALRTNAFSQLSISVNAFFYLYAQNTLALDAAAISNLIVLQTLGIMLGGLATGRISERLGIKRMLQMVEGLGLLVPVMGLVANASASPMLYASIAVFVIGFAKTGLIGYQAYVLEVIETKNSVYYVVAKGLAFLPISFSGVVIGSLIQRFTNIPLFYAQIVLCTFACISASRLKLTVFRQEG